jgi:secreted trypsin-like serine protease
MRLGRALAAAVLLGACASPSSSSVEVEGRAAQAIVGGTETSGDPAVVSVDIGVVSACSGVLIAKDTVLTAGHCAIDDVLLDTPGVTIVFGSDENDVGARTIDVKAWQRHPKYTAAGAGYDVALLTLDRDVTDVVPIGLVDVKVTDPPVGTLVRHVGYGENDEAKGTGQGIKRTATYPITKVDPLLVWSGAPGLQTCDGDSGGPALIKVGASEKILAVVSDGPNCHTDGADARVDVAEVHDWIVTTAKLPVTPPSAVADAGTPAAPEQDAAESSDGPQVPLSRGSSHAMSADERSGGCSVVVPRREHTFGSIAAFAFAAALAIRRRSSTDRCRSARSFRCRDSVARWVTASSTRCFARLRNRRSRLPGE